MKKICKIKELFLFIISISVIPSVFSYITQFSEEELKTYNKLLNKSVGLNIEIAKYEIRMEKIQFNFKLKIKFKHIKEKNNELYEKVKILKKDVNETEFDKSAIENNMTLLTKDYNLLLKKFIKFYHQYETYETFKSNIFDYFKIFLICLISIVIILLIVLIIVGIIVHKRAPKYHTLHEEVSIKQEIDKLHIEKIDNPNKEGESEERKINQNSMVKVEKEKEIKT